jgi:predicted MFS family arabinose efflux permease
MIRTDSWTGRIALMVAHCAGMVDMVALPVWVGTLIAQYKLDPQQAGSLATLFLAGAVASSLFFAPRFNRIRGRRAATLGFGVSALAFFALSATSDFMTMAALHVLAGAAAGCALSFTHGTIGRSANPHRLFAIVGIAIGVFALVFLAGTPQLVAAFGGPVLFKVFAGVMVVAALVSALIFPVPDVAAAMPAASAKRGLDPAVWYAVLGVSCMALVQAMMFSFVERIGADRGFGFAAVTGVLIALGVVNLFPAPLAALLEKRLPARKVAMVGPLVQAVLALVITQSAGFPPYAFATAVFVAVMIFTHTFAFGLLACLDPSGRAVAATPAMLMVGAAIGPVLGGTLVKLAGYGSLGFAAVVIAALAVASFWRSQRRASPAEALA